MAHVWLRRRRRRALLVPRQRGRPARRWRCCATGPSSPTRPTRRARCSRSRELARLELAMRSTRSRTTRSATRRTGCNDAGCRPRVQWFFPHENESGYWWQGENARLALAGHAALLAARSVPDSDGRRGCAPRRRLVSWILGRQPVRRVHAPGSRPQQPAVRARVPQRPRRRLQRHHLGLRRRDRHRLPSDAGGEAKEQSWRWGEQWMPHAAWLLLALVLADTDVPASGDQET